MVEQSYFIFSSLHLIYTIFTGNLHFYRIVSDGNNKNIVEGECK